MLCCYTDVMLHCCNVDVTLRCFIDVTLLLCDVSLPAVCAACAESPPRAVWQFGKMITCVQPNVNPLVYNNYGCYCGFSGSGSPIDQIDQYVLNIPTVTIATNVTTTVLFIASSSQHSSSWLPLEVLPHFSRDSSSISRKH